jgi:hypothetical protein
MSANTGRNALCPCGSGRKYKHCCLQKAEGVDHARLRVRRAEGRVVDVVFPYVLDRFGKAFFEEAWFEFFHDTPLEADNPADLPEFATMFVPWLTTLFVADPNSEQYDLAWPREPVAALWLRTGQPGVTDLEREWLQAACRSPMSVFAVETVEPGRSLAIRDMLTGGCFTVLEQTASRTLNAGDVIFTRVVTAGGISLMFGMAPYVAPPDWQIRVLQWRDAIFRRRKKVTRRLLEEYDIEIRDFYLQMREDLLHPVPPRLQNTDGEDFEQTTLVFELTMPVGGAIRLLEPLATIAGERHVDEVVTDDAGEVTAATLNWMKRGNRRHQRWETTILGRLEFAAGTLTVEVNSAARAERIIREIDRRLGTRAALRSRQAVSPEELMARAHAEAGTRLPRERAPELEALEDDLYRQHTLEWIDNRVPALGHVTPRQAVQTARGRERVEALVAGFARMPDAQRPARLAAIVEMCRELGVTPPRR